MPSNVEKKPRAKKTENKIVANMNTPNCRKRIISASNRKVRMKPCTSVPSNFG